MKKRAFISFFLSVLWALCLTLSPLAADLPSPTDDFYVNDFSGVLTEETEKHIIDVNDQLQPETGAQIVVVAVDFLDGMSSEEYAYQLFNSWGIGSSDKNNGVLILISPGEEKYWITMGRGLETDLSSGILSSIVDSRTDAYFDDENYDRFVTAVFDGIADVLAKKYNVSLYADSSTSDCQEYPSNDEYYESEGPSLFSLILIFIVLVIVVSSVKNRFRRIGGPRSYRRTYIPRPPISTYRPPRSTIHRPPTPRPPVNRSSWGGGSSFGAGPSGFGGSRPGGRSSGFGGGGSRAPRSGGGGSSRGGGFGRK